MYGGRAYFQGFVQQQRNLETFERVKKLPSFRSAASSRNGSGQLFRNFSHRLFFGRGVQNSEKLCPEVAPFVGGGRPLTESAHGRNNQEFIFQRALKHDAARFLPKV